jgi:putative transposase
LTLLPDSFCRGSRPAKPPPAGRSQSVRGSGLKFVTPAQRHNGVAGAVLAQREAVYAEARQRNPRRWSQSTRDWELKDEVWLNPERMQPEELKQVA